MTAETVEARARRLLEAGRVRVLEIRPRRRRVLVTDGTTVHAVSWQARAGVWSCSCPTPPRVHCAHIAAAAALATIQRLPPSAVWWSDQRQRWEARQAP